MGTSEHTIKDLLFKYTKNTISEKELGILHALLKDGMTEDEVKKVLDQHWITLEDEETDIESNLPEVFFEKILEKAKDREQIAIRKRTSWSSLSRIAAVFIGLMAIAGLFYFSLDTNTPTNLISEYTGIGEQKTISLPDGSKVTLNVASQLTYPETFNDTIREIFLKGEAFFEVARNEQQPFVIRSRDLETRVLGTSFNVKAYQNDEQVQVSVATGKVKVSREINKPSRLNGMILQPGEQAVYGTDTGSFTKQYVDADMLTSWRDGVLIFEKITVRDAIKTMERWYDVDIELDNYAIADCIIRSKLDNADLEDVLETLKFILNIEYEQIDGKVVLKGGACSSNTSKTPKNLN